MILPIYESSSHEIPELSKANKGLYFERFFDKYVTQEDKKNTGGEASSPALAIDKGSKEQNREEGKLAFLKPFRGICGNSAQLRQYALRQLALIHSLKENANGQGYELNGHFVTGMGNSHPVENGFLWHHTLGVPYLTGSQVKGLVRILLEQHYKGKGKNDILLQWFGSESKELEEDKKKARTGELPADGQQKTGRDNRTGELIFFDAVPIAPVKLGVDIMTPHMGKWYLDGGKIQKIDTKDADSDKIPADWHDPNPIPFLAVQEAKFLFTIARRQSSSLDIAEVFACLDQALEHLGAGAKTQVGYGYMKSNAEILSELRKQQQKEAMQQQIATASGPDKIKIKIQQMKIEGQLVAALSKNFNKFKGNMGAELNIFCATLAEEEPALLAEWRGTDKNTNEYKAFKKVTAILREPTP